MKQAWQSWEMYEKFQFQELKARDNLMRLGVDTKYY
jgi:hypothetical protein